MLTGAQTPINNLKLPGKQAPDAAPRWARTDQTISSVGLRDCRAACRAMAPLRSMSTSAFLPTSTTTPGGPNTTLHLAYRYNSIPIGPISSMQVRINNAFLGSTPLVPGQETSRTTQTDVAVPVVNLRPFSNTLSFDFTFQLAQASRTAQDTTPINLQGSILRDSYLDLRGYPHWAPMPNLEIFSNAGFPFTRLADLSETTVVLPPAPTEQEIETFVTLMGHFGRQTGFPGLRVTVAGPDALRDGAATDFLIIGSGDDQPAFDKLGNASSRLARQRADSGPRHAGLLRPPPPQRLVEARIQRAHRIRRTHGRWHSRRRHRGHRVSLRHRRQPQHRRHSPQGCDRVRALHGHIPRRAAVQRHLRFRLRSSRNASFNPSASARRSIMWECCRGGRSCVCGPRSIHG